MLDNSGDDAFMLEAMSAFTSVNQRKMRLDNSKVHEIAEYIF